jgi:hypothetical protein
MDMIERACRALCRYNGILPDAAIDNIPAWQSYRNEVLGLISSLHGHDEVSPSQQAGSGTGPRKSLARRQWS